MRASETSFNYINVHYILNDILFIPRNSVQLCKMNHSSSGLAVSTATNHKKSSISFITKPCKSAVYRVQHKCVAATTVQWERIQTQRRSTNMYYIAFCSFQDLVFCRFHCFSTQASICNNNYFILWVESSTLELAYGAIVAEWK